MSEMEIIDDEGDQLIYIPTEQAVIAHNGQDVGKLTHYRRHPLPNGRFDTQPIVRPTKCGNGRVLESKSQNGRRHDNYKF